MMVHNVLLCSVYSETPDTGVKVCPGFPRYGAVEWESLPRIEHRQHRYPTIVLKTPISLPASRSERMQWLKSPGHAQRFLAAYGLAELQEVGYPF